MTKGLFTQDVTRITLAVFFIAVLIATCFWIMRPFLSAIIWATMIVIATWPLLMSIQARLGGRRGAAVLIMTLLLLAILFVPLSFAIIAVIEKSQEIIANSQSLANLKIPPPPEWLQKRLIFSQITEKWQELALLPPAQLSERLSPHAREIGVWFLTQAGSVGMMLVQCFLTIIISAIMYANGESAAYGVRLFFRCLAGQSGEDVVILAAKAVKGVAIGVVGTAMAQSLLGGIGLLITGIPAVVILSALMLLLCVAQLGPGLVLIPATIWLFTQGETGWGIFMVVWTLFIGTMDNFLRPVLIKRGADLPLVLIFAGVIGGLLSFGVIGLFIGPVMLAVTYTLLKEWVAPEAEREQVVTSE